MNNNAEGKRRPIRDKIRVIVLVISLVSMLVTSTTGVLSMVIIKSDSESALIHQMEQNLSSFVKSRVTLADSELGEYARFVCDNVRYIQMLYKNPSAFRPNIIMPPNIKNAGTFTMQRTFATKEYGPETAGDELPLLANLEWLWRSAIPGGLSGVSVMYIGMKSGLMVAYDATSADTPEGEEDYYNYFESEWYNKAKDTGSVCFTDAYLDGYGRGMAITCTTPFYDTEGNFAGAIGMDIMLNDLYRTLVETDVGEDAYAFLIDRRGNLIDPFITDSGETHNIYYDDTIGPDTASRILNRKSGVVAMNGIYYAYDTIASTGWKLCVRVPESVALAPVQSMNRNIIISILVFMLLSALVIAIVTLCSGEFSDRLTKPILELEKDVAKISDGNLEYRAQIHDNDEIGDLAHRFNNMAVSLKEYILDFASVTADKERIAAELNIATKIQADLLPCIFPPFPNRKEFDIYAFMVPAKEVGGDFYDFFFVDGDHLAILVADVSGKGVPSALFMAISKTLIKTRAQMGGTPAEIIEVVNDQLCEESKAEMFVTVWLGIFEISTGKVVATNAGHEYPAIRRAGGAYKLMKLPNNPAVATLNGTKFREDKFTLKPGDSLFLYTDGVAEATHVEGEHEELYGTERMIKALTRHASEPVDQLLASMRHEIDEFVGDSPQFDDLTMLALKYNGTDLGSVV